MRTTLFICALLASMLASAQSQGKKVFVTSKGTKYHLTDTCQYIRDNKNVKPITLADAQKANKTLCKVCEKKKKNNNQQKKGAKK